MNKNYFLVTEADLSLVASKGIESVPIIIAGTDGFVDFFVMVNKNLIGG